MQFFIKHTLFFISLYLLSFQSLAQLSALPITNNKTIQSLNLPNKWMELSSLNLKINGPNCWNFVSYSLGLAQTLRHTSDIEFKDQLKTSCRKISEDEAQKDDVIRIFNPRNNDEVHAMLYVNKDYAYGKHTFDSATNSASQYGLYNIDDVLKDYGSDERNCNKSVDTKFNCLNHIEFYSCSEAIKEEITLDEEYFKDFNDFYDKYLFHESISHFKTIVKKQTPFVFKNFSKDLVKLMDELNVEDFKTSKETAKMLLPILESHEDQIYYIYEFIGYRNSKTLKKKEFREKFKKLITHLSQIHLSA